MGTSSPCSYPHRQASKQEVAASAVRPVHGQKEKKKKRKKKRIFANNPLGFSVIAKTCKTGIK